MNAKARNVAAAIALNIAATIGARRAEQARRTQLIADERARYNADLAMWERELAHKGQTS